MERPRKEAKIEYWLDRHSGECWLQNPACTQCIAEGWVRGDGQQYDLLAWVIMPNHVHVLVRIEEEDALVRIVQTWKSVSAHRINSLLSRKGVLWMRDYHDRYMRSPEHLSQAFRYIRENFKNGGVLYGKK